MKLRRGAFDPVGCGELADLVHGQDLLTAPAGEDEPFERGDRGVESAGVLMQDC